MAILNSIRANDSRKGARRPVGRPRKVTTQTEAISASLAETLLGKSIGAGCRDKLGHSGEAFGDELGHKRTSQRAAPTDCERTDHVRLPRELQDFIDASVAAAFAPVADEAVDDIGRSALMLSTAIERIRRPAAAVERREGQVIEKAIHIALQQAPEKFLFLGKVSVPIWKSARDLCEANSSLDMRRWTVPVSGLPDDTVEFDAVVATTDQREILAFEIKRMASPSHQAELNRAAGTMTLRHAMSRRGTHCPDIRSVHIAWYAKTTSDAVVTRHTIDDVLGIPVRSLVDAALLAFKTQFEARYRALIAMVAPILEAEARTGLVRAAANERPNEAPVSSTDVPSLAEILADLSDTRRRRS